MYIRIGQNHVQMLVTVLGDSFAVTYKIVAQDWAFFNLYNEMVDPQRRQPNFIIPFEFSTI